MTKSTQKLAPKLVVGTSFVLVGIGYWEEFPSTSDVRPIFGGKGNVDEITFADGSSGLTVRLQDPTTGQWSLNWGSNN